MKQNIIILLVSIIILSSCTKPSHTQPVVTDPTADYTSLILGNWTWHRYLLHEEPVGGTPYTKVVRSGGNYTFTSTTWSGVTVDTLSSGDLDSSVYAFAYHISHDTMFVTEPPNLSDTFHINELDATTLQLHLHQTDANSVIDLQTTAKRQ